MSSVVVTDELPVLLFVCHSCCSTTDSEKLVIEEKISGVTCSKQSLECRSTVSIQYNPEDLTEVEIINYNELCPYKFVDIMAKSRIRSCKGISITPFALIVHVTELDKDMYLSDCIFSTVYKSDVMYLDQALKMLPNEGARDKLFNNIDIDLVEWFQSVAHYLLDEPLDEVFDYSVPYRCQSVFRRAIFNFICDTNCEIICGTLSTMHEVDKKLIKKNKKFDKVIHIVRAILGMTRLHDHVVHDDDEDDEDDEDLHDRWRGGHHRGLM